MLCTGTTTTTTTDEREEIEHISTMASHHHDKPAGSSLDLDEEYKKALHTKSYIDMHSRIHQHLSRTSSTIVRQGDEGIHRVAVPQHSHSSPGKHQNGNIPADFLLEPSQESILSSHKNSSCINPSHFHISINSLLFDFFDATYQASNACAALLASIDRARSYHRSVRHLLLSASTPHSPSSSPTWDRLSSYIELENPLSTKALAHFHLMHSQYPTLVRRLTSGRKKVSRRLNLLRFAKKSSGVACLALLSVAVVAGTAVIASHAAAAVAVAPAVVTGSGGILRWVKGWMRLEKTKARVDAAVRGAYIVGRDLDTVSRMVRRVHDEVEHGRDVARMMVRNRESGMVREVVKEMEGRGEQVGLGFEEQLEELKEHVYLCLITINRSRRLVAEETTTMVESSAV